MQHLRSWNLAPSWPTMFGNSVPWEYHNFPGTARIFDRQRWSDHLSEFNTLRLFAHEGSSKKGAGQPDFSAGPLPKAGMGLGPGTAWDWAQGLYGTGPRACVGLGSRCRTILNTQNLRFFFFNFFLCSLYIKPKPK